MASKVEISKRLVLINSAATVGAQILNVCVVIWLQQYLVRHIPAEEYSLLPVLAAVMVLMPLLTTLLTGGISRYLAEAYARGDEQRVTQIVSTAFAVLLPVGIAIAIGGSVLAWHIEKVLTIAPGYLGEARLMMTIMMLAYAVHLSLTPFRVGIFLRQRIALLQAIDLGADLISYVLLAALLFTAGPRVLWVIISSSSLRLCGLFASVWFSHRLVPTARFRASEVRWPLVKTLTSFGAWLSIGQLSEMIRKAADPLILNKLATPVDVASFHLGAMADRQIQPFVTESFNPIQIVMTAMHTLGEKERLVNTYLRLNRLALWGALAAVVPLIVFRVDFFELYLRERFSLYASAATVMMLLLAYYPILFATCGLNRVAVATARLRAFTSLALIGQLANLGLTFYFVGGLRMGAVGSALATLSAGILVSLFGYWPLSVRMTGCGFGRFWLEVLWPGLLPAACSGAAYVGLRYAARPASWIGLAGEVSAGMVVYVIVLLAFSLRPEDRNDLRRVVDRLIPKGWRERVAAFGRTQ